MPVPTDTIYYSEWEWQDWEYRLELIPRSGELLPDTIVYERIPDDCIDSIDDLSKKFGQTLVIGAATAEAIEIDWDIRFAGGELLETLTRPYALNAGNVSALTYTKYFDLSNVLTLKRKSRYETGALWDLLYIGTQKKTIPTTDTITPESIRKKSSYVGLSKHVMEIIDGELLRNQFMKGRLDYGYDAFPTHVLFDFLTYGDSPDGGVRKFGIINSIPDPSEDVYCVMYRFSDLDDAIMRLINMIYFKFLRRAEPELSSEKIEMLNNPFTALTFYTQECDAAKPNSHNKGRALAYDELYFPGRVYVDGVSGGFMWDGHKDQAACFYDYENVWSYYKALSESNGCKMVTLLNLKDFVPIVDLGFYRLWDEIPSNDKSEIALTDALGGEITLEQGAEVLRSAKANINLDGDNRNEYEYTHIGSLAEGDYEVKGIFHNVPTLLEEDYSAVAVYGGNVLGRSNKGIYTNKIYYKQPDTNYYYDNVAVKVHELCDVSDGIDTYSASEMNETIIREASLNRRNMDALNVLITELQNHSTMPLLIATMLAANYGRHYQTLYDAEFLPSEPFVWRLNHVGDVIDLNADLSFLEYSSDLIAGMYSHLGTKALITEINLKLKDGAKGTEKVSCKFLIRG